MDEQILTHKEINGRDPQPGYEWDAGIFPPRVGQLGGRITVRLTGSAWEIAKAIFIPGKPSRTSVIQTFELGEENERAAKIRARQIYEELRPRMKA